MKSVQGHIKHIFKLVYSTADPISLHTSSVCEHQNWRHRCARDLPVIKLIAVLPAVQKYSSSYTFFHPEFAELFNYYYQRHPHLKNGRKEIGKCTCSLNLIPSIKTFLIHTAWPVHSFRWPHGRCSTQYGIREDSCSWWSWCPEYSYQNIYLFQNHVFS